MAISLPYMIMLTLLDRTMTLNIEKFMPYLSQFYSDQVLLITVMSCHGNFVKNF